jgi:hypothetical protein
MSFIDIPIDIAQQICLISNSPRLLLRLGLTCAKYSRFITNWPRNLKSITYFTRRKVNQIGDIHWTVNKKFHREKDLPAAVWGSGSSSSRSWCKNGKYHRDNDLPAYIGSDGYKAWYVNGKRHRNNDLPAIIGSDGPSSSRSWYVSGQRHRDNGLPAIIHENGDKEWWVNGKRIK